MGDISNEPSMEEILSSIKRIIAEDSDAALSVPRTKRAVVAAAPDPVAEPEVLELTDAALEEPMPVSASIARPAAVQPMAKPSAPGLDALASDATVDASRSSMAALSALIVKPEIAGADTLEGMVRDMLKPMLAAWLDANLAELVERQVAKEIARISARG